MRIFIRFFRLTKNEDWKRLDEWNLDDPEASELLNHWLTQYCASTFGGTEWKIEPCKTATGASSAACGLAMGQGLAVGVIAIAHPAGLIELGGMILAVAAGLPQASSTKQTEVGGIILLLGSPVEGLNSIVRFLEKHSIRVEALQVRLFRNGSEFFMATDFGTEEKRQAEEHAVDSELEVFGDPLRVVTSFSNVSENSTGIEK